MIRATILPYATYMYDAVYTIGYAINKSISLGQDFRNGSLLLEQLKLTDFVGATGKVSFDQNLDRVP